MFLAIRNKWFFKKDTRWLSACCQFHTNTCTRNTEQVHKLAKGSKVEEEYKSNIRFLCTVRKVLVFQYFPFQILNEENFCHLKCRINLIHKTHLLTDVCFQTLRFALCAFVLTVLAKFCGWMSKYHTNCQGIILKSHASQKTTLAPVHFNWRRKQVHSEQFSSSRFKIYVRICDVANAHFNDIHWVLSLF